MQIFTKNFWRLRKTRSCGPLPRHSLFLRRGGLADECRPKRIITFTLLQKLLTPRARVFILQQELLWRSLLVRRSNSSMQLLQPRLCVTEVSAQVISASPPRISFHVPGPHL